MVTGRKAAAARRGAAACPADRGEHRRGDEPIRAEPTVNILDTLPEAADRRSRPSTAATSSHGQAPQRRRRRARARRTRTENGGNDSLRLRHRARMGACTEVLGPPRVSHTLRPESTHGRVAWLDSSARPTERARGDRGERQAPSLQLTCCMRKERSAHAGRRESTHASPETAARSNTTLQSGTGTEAAHLPSSPAMLPPFCVCIILFMFDHAVTGPA